MELLDTVVQTVKKHIPDILVTLGVSGVVVGTVMACKETRKLDPILEDHQKRMDRIHMESDTGVLSDKDKRKDTTMAYGKTAYELLKLYFPSALVTSASVGCIIGSHAVMANRNAGLAAAYTGISQAFSEYRENIVKKFGEEADIEAKYGIKTTKKKGKDGKEEVSYDISPDTVCSDHSRFFMAGSKFWNKNKKMNLVNLIQAQQTLNRKLKTRKSHVVTLNEVYDALDLDPSDDGQVLGYIYHPHDDELDEMGLPTVIKFAYWVFDDNKKKNVKKTIEEAIEEDGCGSEPVMLIDFPNLVRII